MAGARDNDTDFDPVAAYRVKTKVIIKNLPQLE